MLMPIASKNLPSMTLATFTRKQFHAGFTLVELIVSVVILGTLLVSGAYFLTHLLYTSNIGIKQRGVEEWGRFDYLLETDIREASAAEIGSIPNGLSCTGSPSDPDLGLLTNNNQVITYYNSTDAGKPVVRRCGPDVDEYGALSTTSSSNNIAFYDATLSASSPNNLFIDYTITQSAPLGTEQGYARLRSRTP
jgi:prepilin-type N-terminal cleavage/methylation domain-containing protein